MLIQFADSNLWHPLTYGLPFIACEGFLVCVKPLSLKCIVKLNHNNKGQSKLVHKLFLTMNQADNTR